MTVNKWASDNIPPDVLDSKLFKFVVTLPNVKQHFCRDCNVVFDIAIFACPTCSSAKIETVNKQITVDMMGGASLNYESVENILPDIPSQFAFWGAVYAESKLRVNICERVFKSARGKAYDEIIKAGQKEGVRITADQMKHIVESDVRVINADIDFASAKMISSKLYYMVETLKMKGELARSLTSLKKSELLGS